jgi:hypothetical protein
MNVRNHDGMPSCLWRRRPFPPLLASHVIPPVVSFVLERKVVLLLVVLFLYYKV